MPVLVKCRNILNYLKAEVLSVHVDDMGLLEASGELQIPNRLYILLLVDNYLGFTGDPEDLMNSPIMQTLFQNKLIKKTRGNRIMENNYDRGWAEYVNPLASVFHHVSSPRHSSLLSYTSADF